MVAPRLGRPSLAVIRARAPHPERHERQRPEPRSWRATNVGRGLPPGPGAAQNRPASNGSPRLVSYRSKASRASMSPSRSTPRSARGNRWGRGPCSGRRTDPVAPYALPEATWGRFLRLDAFGSVDAAGSWQMSGAIRALERPTDATYRSILGSGDSPAHGASTSCWSPRPRSRRPPSQPTWRYAR